MSNLAIWMEGDSIMLQIESDEGTASFSLGDDKAKALLLNLAGLLLRKNDATALVASATNPQVGVDGEGCLVLTVDLEPLPPVQIRLTDPEARDLADAIGDLLTQPIDIRRAGIQ